MKKRDKRMDGLSFKPGFRAKLSGRESVAANCMRLTPRLQQQGKESRSLAIVCRVKNLDDDVTEILYNQIKMTHSDL